MSLKACSDCNETISRSALWCPHCGSVQLFNTTIVVMVLGTVLACLSSCVGLFIHPS
jgi:hypothetical protein